MNLRKIELMYREFGKTDGATCGTCSNFISGRYHTKYLSKCTVYGCTHSEASDWRKKYPACGCYNKEWKGNDIMGLVKHAPRPKERVEIDGQRSMFDEIPGAEL